MSLFYLIHILILFEVVLALGVVFVLQEKIAKIRDIKSEILSKSEKKLEEIKLLRKFFTVLNKKYEERKFMMRKLFKELLKDVLLSWTLKKFVIKSLGSRLQILKTFMLGFMASLAYFETKNA